MITRCYSNKTNTRPLVLSLPMCVCVLCATVNNNSSSPTFVPTVQVIILFVLQQKGTIKHDRNRVTKFSPLVLDFQIKPAIRSHWTNLCIYSYEHSRWALSTEWMNFPLWIYVTSSASVDSNKSHLNLIETFTALLVVCILAPTHSLCLSGVALKHTSK